MQPGRGDAGRGHQRRQRRRRAVDAARLLGLLLVVVVVVVVVVVMMLVPGSSRGPFSRGVLAEPMHLPAARLEPGQRRRRRRRGRFVAVGGWMPPGRLVCVARVVQLPGSQRLLWLKPGF